MRMLSFISAAALLCVITVHLSSRARPASKEDSPRQPVIVELFTSEGCSSCPPADTLLKTLSETQPFDGVEILALEEHVDYWNHLGWSDPFSSSDFTRRQENYASSIQDSSVYTPQLIVDGNTQLVGSRSGEARAQIRLAAAHPKSRLLLSPTSATNPHSRSFELRLDRSSAPLPTATLDLYLAVTERGLRSNVTAGENSGESLAHAPVVRQLRKLQPVSAPFSGPLTVSVDLRDNWNLANLTVIAFLADPRSHQILAAGSCSAAL